MRNDSHPQTKQCAAAPRRAFTLVELFVVIAIIGVLTALLLPAIQAAREASRTTKCSSNLHQLGIALQGYHTATGAFPPGGIDRKSRRLSWAAMLLPYIEEQNAFCALDRSRSYLAAENSNATRVVVHLYLCPSTARIDWDRDGDRSGDRNRNGLVDVGEQLGMTDYGGIYGTGFVTPLNNGVMLWDTPIGMRRIVDGASHTLQLGEDTGRGPGRNGEWSNGENIFDIITPINTQQDNELWSDHPRGVNLLFCDGRVHFMDEETAIEVLSALATRAGRECITP